MPFHQACQHKSTHGHDRTIDYNQLYNTSLKNQMCENNYLSSAWGRLFPFFCSATPFGMPFRCQTCISKHRNRGNTAKGENTWKLTMPSFHFIAVAVIFVPSSRKVKVFVSFVSSKYGLGLKCWRDKYMCYEQLSSKLHKLKLLLEFLDPKTGKGKRWRLTNVIE